MDILGAFCMCIKGQPEYDCDDISEKQQPPPARPTTQDVAINILNALYDAEKPGELLKRRIEDIVEECGWTENLAAALLSQLENALKSKASMGQAMRDAFNRSMDAAVGFAHDHPVFCTLIALGIFVILLPWVIEFLGFSELGPIEGISSLHQAFDCQASLICEISYSGTFAAWWQLKYAGYVPNGSLFSFFQRLGMVWKRKWCRGMEGETWYTEGCPSENHAVD